MSHNLRRREISTLKTKRKHSLNEPENLGDSG